MSEEKPLPPEEEHGPLPYADPDEMLWGLGEGDPSAFAASDVTTEDVGQLDIVKRQFKKNKAAVAGLWVAIILAHIAIFAPVIASGDPIKYQAPGEDAQYPWFAYLFDVISWEHALDRAFNFLMVVITLYWVGFLVTLFISRPKRDAIRSTMTKAALAVAAIGFFLFVTGLAPTTSHKKVDYRAPVNAVRAAKVAIQRSDDQVAKTRDAIAGDEETLEAIDFVDQRLAGENAEYDDAMVAELESRGFQPTRELATAEGRAQLRSDVEQRLERRLFTIARLEAGRPTLVDGVRLAQEERNEYTIVMTPIPYGYREQLPLVEDKFLPAWTFDGDEVHLFGTGETGRDIFARILYGTRISLTIGIVAVGIYVTIGTILGALAGYFGGRVDMVIMRVVEIVICIPGLFLMLTIVSLFEKRSIMLIMFAIGVVAWTGITRLVRGEFLRERNMEYVEAARSMGYKTPRIIFRHILPNSLGPVLVAATFGIPGAILAESGLSFLGLGDVSVPSWGRILYDARTHEYWHLIIPPSVAIFVTVTALNLVGDGLRDALDPKLRA